MTDEKENSVDTDKNITQCGITCANYEVINNGKSNVQENGTYNNNTTAFIIEDSNNYNLSTQPSKLNPKISCCRRSACQVVWVIFLTLISILGFIFPPRELLLREKLNMRPGLPTVAWWMDPPDVVKLKVYIFNVTNHERFLAGDDEKINVEEIGPIVYVENIKHFNVTYNPDDTLTYLSKRKLTLLPEESKYSVNDSVVVPNGAVLGIASMLHNRYFARAGFNILLNMHTKNFFVKTTIDKYLWDFTDDILSSSKAVAPSLVPVTNIGILNRTFEQFTSEVTVKMGPRWGHHDFFRIQKFKDVPALTGYDVNRCLDSITDGSDGILFHQYISKQDVLFFFQKAMCTLLPLQFSEETVVDGMTVYKFNFSNTALNRVPENASYCYEDSTLPSGIKDASKCYYDFPLVLSYPHFYFADIPKDAYVTGLAPDANKHAMGSFHIEPITGTPFRVSVKIQCNIQIHNIKGLYSEEFDKFSGLVIPTLWMDTVQEEISTKILVMLYFVVIILPMLSPILFLIAIITGLVLIYKKYSKIKMSKKIRLCVFRNKKLDIEKNKDKVCEQEIYLEKSSDSIYTDK